MTKLSPPSKWKSMLYVCSGAAACFSGLCYYQGNEKFYDNVLLPVIHKLDPEVSHNVAIVANKYGFIPKSSYRDPESLKTKVWNIQFTNPVGVAAGFDKDGECIRSLHDIGFGFVEVGSVTPLPQTGNDKPRVFRLEKNKAIINRYGFNSQGHKAVFDRLSKLREEKFNSVIGINLGKNKTSSNPIHDYEEGIKLFGPIADYLVINISSPNTPGLRDMQKKEQLKNLLTSVINARNGLSSKPPLLLKLSPDLSTEQLTDIANIILQPKCQVDGLIISNTSTKRNSELDGPHINEEGGLSGKPISKQSMEMISTMFSLTKGKIPIVGVGGIFSGLDAYEKIKAGASLVQIYTSFAYHGPPIVTKIKQELHELLLADGYKSVGEAVGKNT